MEIILRLSNEESNSCQHMLALINSSLHLGFGIGLSHYTIFTTLLASGCDQTIENIFCITRIQMHVQLDDLQSMEIVHSNILNFMNGVMNDEFSLLALTSFFTCKHYALPCAGFPLPPKLTVTTTHYSINNFTTIISWEGQDSSLYYLLNTSTMDSINTTSNMYIIIGEYNAHIQVTVVAVNYAGKSKPVTTDISIGLA